MPSELVAAQTSASSKSANGKVSIQWSKSGGFNTFLRSPFFHRYPDLMTLSSTESRGFPLISADFHPPSSSSSSSESSPLPDLLSAIDDSGCCIDDVPACKLPLTPWIDVWPEEAKMSGERIESESDSVPETGAPPEMLDG